LALLLLLAVRSVSNSTDAGDWQIVETIDGLWTLMT
jgi:hypothetical protein